MNTFTALAVDAYRQQEAARRSLSKAEDRCNRAAKHIPTEEMPLWFLATEIIRFEVDLAFALEVNDRVSAREIQRQLDIWRPQLSEMNRQLEADKALAEKEDRPVAPGEAKIGDNVPGADDNSASWQAARGAVPRTPGSPRAEDVIRRNR